MQVGVSASSRPIGRYLSKAPSAEFHHEEYNQRANEEETAKAAHANDHVEQCIKYVHALLILCLAAQCIQLYALAEVAQRYT